MGSQYIAIRNEYLARAWARGPEVLAACLPAEPRPEGLLFRAFGEDCLLTPKDVFLASRPAEGPEGVLIALYAGAVTDQEVDLYPLRAFKELPGSMPYQAAFAANAEAVLVPWVERIFASQDHLIRRFSGHPNEDAAAGDFSFTLRPLPKIPLYYVFHLPDEEFPAAVTCLFAAASTDFMPLDALADVAEYTAQKIIGLMQQAGA
ncbi:MAG: DUF3786 domain-containing protein [Deltaproteobacteria bacterium]|nr:DUF3786 domain-containing protein [Deltaproteobacteria bacterium]